MRKITFSNPAKSLVRFFCLNGFLVEFLGLLRVFLRTHFQFNFSEINSMTAYFNSDFSILIVDSISLLLFIFVFIVPEKIGFVAIISFLYSFKIILIDTLAKNPLGQPLYLLGISCLLYSGFYKNHRLLKIILSVLFNFLLVGYSIRYGVDVLLQSFIISVGYGLVLLASIFFTTNFLRLVHARRTARVWDLSQYPDLTQRDKEWLKDILDEKKYEEIANDSGITVGTLKNRMHQIFNIIGIEDRIQLIASYSGYEVKF